MTRIPDATFLNDFRRCPEYARLRHEHGLKRPGREDAPAAGSAWHAAMYEWFEDAGLDAALQALRDNWGAEVALEAPDAKRPLGQFEAMLSAYAETYPRADDPFEVLRNETYIGGTILLVNNPAFDWCAIIDRKIRYADGGNYIMDTKTTSGWLNGSYWAGFERSVQLIGGCALELVHGHECDGFLIDAVHVDTRYHKVKSEHFVRFGPVRVPDWKLSDWARTVEQAMRSYHDCLDRFGLEQRWPQHEASCYSWNRPCPFRDVCDVPSEMMEDMLQTYVVEKWEPKEVARNVL